MITVRDVEHPEGDERNGPGKLDTAISEIFTGFQAARGGAALSAHTGAVTLIQCFGEAINLNIHFHMLVLDGVISSAEG